MRPTLEIARVNGSISHDIIDQALGRRGLAERVTNFAIRPGESSSSYQFRFERRHELTQYLSLTLSRNGLGETRGRVLLGTYTIELAEGLTAGAVGIALAQQLNRVPNTLEILSLTADEKTAAYDTALAGITRYTTNLEHSLTNLNRDGSTALSFSRLPQGVLCIGLDTLAHYLRNSDPNN